SSDGTLWFSDRVLSAPWAGVTRAVPLLGTITTNGVADSLVVGSTVLSHGSDRGLCVILAPDGDLWLNKFTTVSSEYELFYMSPAGVFHPGDVTSGGGYPFFLRIDVPNRLAAGPDGNVWFTQPGQVVGRNTTNGVGTIFNTTNVNANALVTG